MESMNKAMIQQLVQILEELISLKCSPQVEYLKIIKLVNEYLEILYEIEIQQIKLSESDKNIIGPLIYESLIPLSIWISHTTEDLSKYNLYKEQRSGLQFLLDNYQDFPDGTGKLLKDAFKEFLEFENLEGWDEQFKHVCNCFDIETDIFVDEPMPDMTYIPETHWWWKFLYF